MNFWLNDSEPEQRLMQIRISVLKFVSPCILIYRIWYIPTFLYNNVLVYNININPYPANVENMVNS